MATPYKISTLLYCFSENDEILLMRRRIEPNRGLWSPCGGKLHTASGESPYACACREAFEETGIEITPADIHLNGVVSECGYANTEHWLMFLFEVRMPLEHLPRAHREGEFRFFNWRELDSVDMPATDKEMLWPLFRRCRGGFFAAHCRYDSSDKRYWIVEEALDAGGARVLDLP
ncbi:MAG: NUDIX domain-containing protein [Verrucomicrobia bacterium]|nr:NUDIX domain-containing protein [Verrucomicrobiota bacterium]